MIETFTKNDVVKYLYNETTEEETKNIEIAKLIYSEVEESIEELKGTIEFLNENNLQPSNRTIENILNFAKNYPEVVA